MINAADFSKLDAYLVGGAVRDARLGRAVGDRDWVVVGSSVAEMLELGFTQVGRDFPVFLHPQTHEEYALARTERKQGAGHTGFVVHADSEVTLEEDLKRRDLTINAMAETPDGTLIDPYGGLEDLESRLLRHVSAAFGEDPLRVLRVARFAAVLPEFRVAPETAALMADMCRADVLAELSAERVWQELVRALAAPAPERFFEVLDACGGLEPWFAELAGVELRFSAGGALHRFAELPVDDASLPRLCGRLKAPKLFVEAAQDWRRYGALLGAADDAEPAELVDALEALRAHHDTRRLEFVLDHLQHTAGVDQMWLLAVAGSLAEVSPSQNVAPGPAYGRALREARAARLAQAQQQR